MDNGRGGYQDQPSGNMPDPYDRQMAMLHDLPDVAKTKPSAPIRVIPPMGVGGIETFLVQTYRQAERGDTIFLEVVTKNGATRVVIPPAVANLIARQRDSLTTKVRSRIGKTTAANRAALGLLPAFMQEKKKG